LEDCYVAFHCIHPLTPNDPYRGRTAPLTSKVAFFKYIYLTNIGTEYFKRGIYSPIFSLQNAVCFVILTYLVPVFFTFYIQVYQNLKKKKSGAKRLTNLHSFPKIQYNTQLESRRLADASVSSL
jgi:hypothetical protein